MEIDQLLDSFSYRFAASGVRKPIRTAEELLANVFKCRPPELHRSEIPDPPSSGQMMGIIRELECLAVRIESGEEPQTVLNCLDF